MNAVPYPPELDSVDRDREAWFAELPGIDADVEEVHMRLRRLAKLSEQMLSQIARQHALTLGDWETLSALRRSGTPYVMTPSELVEALGVTSGTISVRLERLQQAGLVEPASGTVDGRSRPVRLTAEGSRRWRAATDERTRIEDQLFRSALQGDGVRRLNRLLRRLMIEMESTLG